ncbi:MAG: class I SAM-dependent methyltransferase [Candidatus Omnitrophica bacterium]|nr:class I SAM-dependent methyltransferase [Candidatus Omnitrophota bacterium]
MFNFNKEFFEYTPCNLCGNDAANADVLYDAIQEKIPGTAEAFMRIYSSSSSEVFYERLVRCKQCGLIYISPRPRRELIINGYSSAQDRQYVSQERGRTVTFKNCLKIIKRLSDKGKLLDIGAASGIFVKVAKDAGYQACGVEPSLWMCKIAKERYGVSVFPGTLEAAGFKDDSFDIITMWDVLEHVPDPMKTLKDVKRVLKPGGLLIVNYPRIDDPLARIFGRKWWFLLSVHLFYFTPKTLLAYMEKLGFEKIVHRPHFQKLEYDYLVERLSVYSKFLAKIAKLPYIIPGFKKILIPYFASQYLMILRKKR